ncbi:MAG: glycoside hydrolase family 3 C-terminal domain-containing protein [Actinomycetota bacterium]|nr:glycoside hydrolase family 3 C-terminal domain-containing protein [Actinomycetota bacterium]
MNIASLLSQLTLEEKAALCLGGGFWHTRSIERLGIPAIMMSDGPHGLRRQDEAADHLGLSGSVPATCFPTASALGSSWNTALVERVGRALGTEARAGRVSLVLGPGVNMKRSPLCGRNFEYFSEDPVLSGELGAALVRGIQSQAVGACVKHYAANNQETDRLRVSADVDERPLREIYLSGFERVVRGAAPWAVMCGYNKVNGTYASEHRELLTEVLRHQWGFEGLVVSDWGAVHDRVAALAAGLDLEMPPNLGVSDAAIVAAVRSGGLHESMVDAAVSRVLALVERAHPGLATTTTFGSDDHHKLARAAAGECAVLLKNDDRMLPLRPAPGSRLAVIGEFARTPRYQGAGSSQVNPTRVDVALDELRTAAPGVDVAFAPGFSIDTSDDDRSLAEQAVALATGADTVVMFLGLPPDEESEGFDRRHMNLPANQMALLSRVAAVNDRIVAVVANGSAVQMADWDHQAKAVLECWLLGQAGGGAVADLLLGVANPSGRLAETLPLRLEDSPSHLNFPGDSGHVRYGEGIFVGYRGHDASKAAVSYPFGHGLSYTTFAYRDLTVRVSGSHDAGDLAIVAACRITNTGDRVGQEVVQLYVRDVEASVARPVRELKAFAKVRLDPGATTTVRFELGSRDLSYWAVTVHDWVLEAGAFELAVGASSRDLRLLATIDIAARPIGSPIGAMSTLAEWLADPEASMALRSALAAKADHRLLDDPALIKVVGGFPLHTLAAFPNTGLDPATLEALIERLGPRQPLAPGVASPDRW